MEIAENIPVATRKVASVNPATGELLHEFSCASLDEVRSAVSHARSAQPAWGEKPVAARLAVLMKFGQLLHKNKSAVARLITQEAGKPWVEGLIAEVAAVLDAVRFCVEQGYPFLREQLIPHGNPAMKTKSGRIRREPYGVIGIISPWNYPFSTPATESIAALAMGNAVVVKPSELTSLCALRLADLLHQAGVPPDVFQVIPGDGATGAALVNSGLDKLIFTGSVATGKRIAHAAAEQLLPTVLELGGKDPMIVLDDADIDVASSGALWGAFMNTGQTCLSVERCYVHSKLYERFVAACVEKTGRLRVGNGMDPETDIGPMNNLRQLQIVEGQVQDARAQGARVLCGGARLPDLGPNFYAPTVLLDVTHEMRIMREETFGPVLPIMAFDSEEEAIGLANDSEYGLAASVWTRDPKRGEKIAARIQAGTVMINDAVSCYSISEAPHGGIKASGIGRSHGRFGLEEMVRIKYIDTDRMPGMKKVWWFDYGATFTRQMEGFVDALFAPGLGARLRGALKAKSALRRKGRI